MIKPKTSIIYFTFIFVSVASVSYADVIWPAIYVAGSRFRFWYVVLIGLFLEACVLRCRLIPNAKKAFIVSLVVNALSATVGIYILMFGMIGWHFVIDNFVQGTFAPFNKGATIIIMMVGSVALEMWTAQAIWKYPLRQTFFIFIIGNILSYGVVVCDLYFFGGWDRQY